MEEQLTPLLIEILNNSSVVVDSTILGKYYQLFDENRYLGNSYEKIYADMEEHYGLNIQSQRYGYDNQEEKEIYQKLIIALINEQDKKQKIKLVPLIIFLDSNRYLYDYLYNIKYFKDFIFDIKDYFVNTIKESGIKIQNLDDLPEDHHEKEWFRSYSNGLKDNDFQKIYSLIEGFEKGRGFNFDIYIDFLVFITYKYFFNNLVDIANEKKDMLEIIYLINILSIEETLYLAKQSSNILLKFEAIRKAVYFKSNRYFSLNLLKHERELLKELIIELSNDNQLWQEFLAFFIKYPLRSIQLFEPLSKVILNIDNNKINLLVKNIKIDKYSDENSKYTLESMFFNIKDKEKQRYILEKIFDKWIEYINNYQEYLGTIVLTDVINIIIYHIQEFAPKNFVINELKKSINSIEEIDNKWFKDISEKNNYFYKQMSKIFIYSWVVEKYNLKDVLIKIEEICNNFYFFKKEGRYSNSNETTLELFEEYILKKVVKNDN